MLLSFRRPRFAVLPLLLLPVLAFGSASEWRGEPHLNVVARSEQEVARVAAVVAPAVRFDEAERYEARPAGAATVRLRDDRSAFSQPSANMSFENQMDFNLGDSLFAKLWVSSPASTLASDGLGPLYNARSCQRCHVKDGRGHPPRDDSDSRVSMFLRVSVPGGFGPHDGEAMRVAMAEVEGYLAAAPDPVYGGQIQDLALAGHRAEARMVVRYEPHVIALAGEADAVLRAPQYGLEHLGYGPLAPGAVLSPRVAPQMIGLGLLEAIPAADILAAADPVDADGDGISGRANVVWSREYQRPMLGRFGLKAGMATLREQTASAFAGDVGISSPLFPAPYGDCRPAQAGCLAGPHGDGDAREFEIDSEGIELVTFYARNLGVPERRSPEAPGVLRGKALFYETGCISCHRPKHVTHRLADRPEQSFQLIWPYTDLLLHDMGEGLADHRPEARANGREWRTPPLWGIGLTEQVTGQAAFLHDGRARSLLEAVLWHGGEAEAQRVAVQGMTPAQRADLIDFLESL